MLKKASLLSLVFASNIRNALSSSGVCGTFVKKEHAGGGVCVCVCVFYKGEVTHGGHSSGQHQLSECEVQPQAKASLPVGVNLTLLVYPHTHTATEPGAALAHTRLPPSKRCALHSAGTSPSL